MDDDQRGTPPGTRRLAALRGRIPAAVVVVVTPLLRWAVVTHAVPAGEPSRSTCPACGARAGLRAPGLRALLPAARCGACGHRVGAPPYAVETAVVAGAAALSASDLSGWEWAAYGWWALYGIMLAFVDVAVHRLPDRLTLPAAAGFLLLAAPAALAGQADAWVRAALAALAVAAGTGLLALLRPSAMGFGDAKLGLAVGAAAGWIGWSALLGAIFLASLAAGVYGLALVVSRRAKWSSHIPLGPFLIAGTLAAVALTR